MKNNGKLISIFSFSLFLAYSFSVGMCQTTPNKPDVEPGTPRKPTIVAVIDTGFDFDSTWKDSPISKPRLCKYGHSDFTGMGLKDAHGHGTHIAGLIGKYAGKSNYCLVIMKYYHLEQKEKIDHMQGSLLAFQKAINIKVDIINFSGGGVEKSEWECKLMKQALNMGIVVVTAAGNERSDINEKPYYPAMCDNRIIAVANVDRWGYYQPSSNYTNAVLLNARELAKEEGSGVLSLLPNDRTNYMTGTSQAAAIKTGKIVKEREKQ
jgi:subtilisin family serine protease